MNGKAAAFDVRRIVVALDAASGSAESLEAAAEIAERLSAELIGLFVEDVNLLRSGALPFVRQVSVRSGMWQDFDAHSIEREMRAGAAEARRLLETAAARRRVAHSFRVVRGQVAREVAAAAADADLLIVEGTSRPLTPHIGLASTTRVAAKAAVRSVFLLRPGTAGHNLVALYDDAPGADRALAAATSLARSDGGALTILVLAPTDDAMSVIEDRARRLLGERGARAVYRPFAHATIDTLCALLRAVPDSILVVSADSPLVAGPAAERLMDRVACALLLVR